MILIADRTNDLAVAETAVGQIEAAREALRDGGQGASAADLQAQLPKAQAIRAGSRGSEAGTAAVIARSGATRRSRGIVGLRRRDTGSPPRSFDQL
jgi:hypothetical protein